MMLKIIICKRVVCGWTGRILNLKIRQEREAQHISWEIARGFKKSDDIVHAALQIYVGLRPSFGELFKDFTLLKISNFKSRKFG